MQSQVTETGEPSMSERQVGLMDASRFRSTARDKPGVKTGRCVRKLDAAELLIQPPTFYADCYRRTAPTHDVGQIQAEVLNIDKQQTHGAVRDGSRRLYALKWGQ